jgi:hypothetical protein
MIIVEHTEDRCTLNRVNLTPDDPAPVASPVESADTAA